MMLAIVKFGEFLSFLARELVLLRICKSSMDHRTTLGNECLLYLIKIII